ncbi:hypothetical protein AT730_02505 [Vibrio alginolyticus]|nr:hypothetical protein AT730_02505 [Vibrio alginolyticus]
MLGGVGRFFLTEGELEELAQYSIEGNSFASQILRQSPAMGIDELITFVLSDAHKLVKQLEENQNNDH